MNGAACATRAIEAEVWRCLEGVADPEIPVLSIVDLGIVRHVRIGASGRVEVGLSPTYSGCPATALIKAQVAQALESRGWHDAGVVEVLAPPWTTAWISAEGHRRLREYGIAPPAQGPVACPRCGSQDTRQLVEFGSTPCKALYRCADCLEPFEHFKCL